MCGQPPKGVVGCPSGSAPRRRVGRVDRGSHDAPEPRACARGRMRFASLLEAGAPALPSPARNLRAVPLREPSIPRPGRDRRSTWGVESLASFALGHLVVLALDRRQCPCSPRKRRGRRGDRRPSLCTQTLRRWGLPAAPAGAAPSLGAQSSRRASVRRRRRDRASTPVRSSRDTPQRSPGALRADTSRRTRRPPTQ